MMNRNKYLKSINAVKTIYRSCNYICPFSIVSCKWKGPIYSVMEHLIVHHNKVVSLQGEDVTFLVREINLPVNDVWVMIQSCFGLNFMIIIEKKEKFKQKQFSARVHLIGSCKVAHHFIYQFKLESHQKSLTWEAPMSSIPKGISGDTLNNDCFVFDQSKLTQFAYNENLSFRSIISQTYETFWAEKW